MSYRERVSESYITSNLGRAANRLEEIQKDYAVHKRYFEKNYSKYMPKNKDADILDLGCGMGHFLHFARGGGFSRTIGCDSSEECIAFCKERNFNVVHSNIFDFLAGKENCYDVIVFNDVIEHLYKDEIIEILDLIYVSLKPKGVLLIKTPNMANPWVSTAGRYICLDHEIGFTEYSMMQVLMICKFKNIKIIGTNIYVFSNPINYVAWLLAKFGEGVWYLLSYLYGRNSLKIFTKDILAIAYKENLE